MENNVIIKSYRIKRKTTFLRRRRREYITRCARGGGAQVG